MLILRLFYYSSFFLFMGNWFGITALNWFVFETYHSAIYLGYLNFARLIPIVLFSFWAGKLCDKYARSLLLKTYGLLGFIIALCLAVVIAVFEPSISILLFLTFLQGIISALETPNRNSILPDLAKEKNISELVSAHAFIINVCRTIGPAAAGFLIARSLLPVTFYLQALFLLISFLLILPVNIQRRVKRTSKMSSSSLQAVQKVFKQTRFASSIFYSSLVVMTFGFSYNTILPVLVDHQFVGQPAVFGIAMSSAAVGAIMAAVVLPRILKVMKEEKIFYSSLIIFAGSLYITIFEYRSLFFIGLFLIGFFGQWLRSSNRIYFQNHVSEAERGRVMSIVLMDRGMIPLGAMIVSFLTGKFGIVETFMIMALCSLLPIVALLIKACVQNVRSRFANEFRKNQKHTNTG
ncbi:MFS transporter [Bacillus taeanensis]|uniref:MFS transporter n=1 Tax=Bacillus taeanensis TaxID=273032 RepID=A0A366XT90_9BACI|nr:MFS transporter [Bacillus taeanensis]RBW68768.1 MFS transporter [Bacillus taeanensis]